VLCCHTSFLKADFAHAMIAECEAALAKGVVSYHLPGRGQSGQRVVASPRKGVAAMNRQRPRRLRTNDYVLHQYAKSQSARKQWVLIEQFDGPAVEAS
jgi:hypothetical protein